MTAQVLPKDEARRIYNALVAKIKDPALAAENRQGALALTPPPVRADRRTASYQEYWDLVE